MPFQPGQQLSHYRLLEKIGEGGMGVVWKARDTSLGRNVAIKVLPEALSRDAERQARFQREAKLLASLNHPNIAAIYDLESHEGHPYLVMELVGGETLARKISAGGLSTPQALDAAAQIAEALDAAHESGIIHRDLKPANVMVDDAGKVKLLDFGLAKHFDDASVQPDHSGALTEGPTMTGTGTVLGTTGYMSPEQARGEEVDRRADIWSLGCILFEALSGRQAFHGDTAADVLVAVLGQEPDWAALPPETPVSIRQLLERCLHKDRDRRLDRVRQARDTLAAATAQETAPARVGWLPWLGAAVVLVVVALVLLQPRAPAPGSGRRIPTLAQVTFAQGVERWPAWAPDGRALAFTAEVNGLRKIFVKNLEQGTERQLTHGDFDDIQPGWSTDGRAVLFVRARQSDVRLEPGDVFGVHTGGDVWTVGVESGDEHRLVENAFNPAASPDGARIAVDASWVGASRIWLVDSQGRNPVQLTTDASEDVGHMRPRWSPGGRRIVFQVQRRTVFDLAVVDVGTHSVVALTDDHFRDLNPVWSHDGASVYFSSDRSGGYNVWRIGVDRHGGPRGAPQQISTGAGQDIDLAMSPAGPRLAFSILKQNADVWMLPVSPRTGEQNGSPTELIATTREDSRGAWSPDGTLVAFNSDRSGNMNIWVHDTRDGSARQLTRGPGGDYQPRWSPDGGRITFFSSRAGNADVWVVGRDGSGLVQRTDSPAAEVNPAFSPDGQRIAYQSDQEGRREVWLMDADGGSRKAITQVGVTGHYLRWTPDGATVVFLCPCGGQPQLMLAPREGGEAQPLPEVVGGWHISFSPDRSRILDVSGHRALWISPLNGGSPERVFQFDEPGVRIDYPVWSPDGEKVLFDRFQPQGGDLWVMDGF